MGPENWQCGGRLAPASSRVYAIARPTCCCALDPSRGRWTLPLVYWISGLATALAKSQRFQQPPRSTFSGRPGVDPPDFSQHRCLADAPEVGYTARAPGRGLAGSGADEDASSLNSPFSLQHPSMDFFNRQLSGGQRSARRIGQAPLGARHGGSVVCPAVICRRRPQRPIASENMT